MRSKHAAPAARIAPREDVLELWFEFMRLSQEVGRRERSRWDGDVAGQIRPKPGQTFASWFQAKHYFFEPTDASVVPLGPMTDPATRNFALDEDDQVRYAVSIDVTAPLAHIVESIAYLVPVFADELELKRSRRPGPPKGRAAVFVEYAPNGQVDMTSLRKALRVYTTRKLVEERGERISNEQLWDEAVRPLLPIARQAVDPDVEVKRAEVSRHIRRAKEIIKGVRKGRFPFHDRERAQSLGPL